MASDAQGNQHSDSGGATEMHWLLLVLNKASSVFFLVSEAGEGGHWLLLKSLLSVLAVSLSSGAPLQHIKRCPKTKLLCGVFSSPQRQIANEAPVSKLRSVFRTLVSGFSTHCKKKETLSVCSHFCNSSVAQRDKGILKSLFAGSWFLRTYLKRQTASVLNLIFLWIRCLCFAASNIS